MFSCLLLHSQSPDQPVVATRCDTRLHTIGWLAHGAISVRFDLSQQMTETVLYVPTLCVHHSKGRTHLRVTGCKVKRERSGETATVQHFALRRTPESNSQPKHSYSELKRRCCKAVSRWGGVQSSRDFILRLGTMEKGSSLTVELDFVASVEPQMVEGDIHCTFGTMLPANSHFLDVTVFRTSKVRLLPNSLHHPGDMEPTVRWTHCEEDFFSRVQGNVTEWTVTEPFGLTLQLQTPDDGELTAEVASLLLPRPISVDSPSGEKLRTIDGLLLLNCMLKSPAHLGDTRPRFAPSEFIFLVDCSGSMSGLKIQMASETLILCLKSLPRGCRFNIIAFGSKYYHLFPSSEEISEKMLEKGVQFANQLKACLGGTELLTPVRWLLRRPPCNGLPRQVFLITDGGAPNHQAVLQAVTKHKRDTRFHLFGLGQDVCPELIARIAAISGGSSIIVEKGQRLQAQVINVLTRSLLPHFTNATPLWTPPRGHEVAEAIPHSLGTIFAGTGRTSLALLRKTGNMTNNHTTPPCPAALSGCLEGQEITAPTSPSLQLFDPGSSKAAELLLKAAAFVKIESLEEELFVGNARRSQPQQESIGEPPTKRLRMNGVLHNRGHALEEKAECSLQEELISFSCHFGIPTVFTHLYPSSPKGEEPTEQIILPDSIPIQRHQQQQQQELPHSSSLLSTEASPRHSQRRRKRPREGVVSSVVSSLTSLARGTVSTFGSVVKTAVSITTLGLVNLDENREDTMEAGERIEDQIYHEEKRSRIHWDKNHQLVFPSCYYLSHPGNQGDVTNGDKAKGETSARPNKDHLTPDMRIMDSPVGVPVPSSTPSEASSRSVPANFDLPPPLLEDAGIAAAPPTSYYPIVLLQHFSGGWLLTQPLCHATGIPMHVIHSLPLCGATLSSTPLMNNSRLDSSRAFAPDGHFWATVIALTCLKELFRDSHDEWCLVAHKGEVWLEEREKDFPVPLHQAWEISRGLVVRSSTTS